MMGGEAPETCWATHKRQAMNLWKCCILLVDLFESYDDARTCERQIVRCVWYLWPDDGQSGQEIKIMHDNLLLTEYCDLKMWRHVVTVDAQRRFRENRYLQMKLAY